ncbi:MAG: divalent metal cation transporter [Nitrososphaerota archaeon]|nr:divalent metal cation transporter [Nitrososphaerota archaeon]
MIADIDIASIITGLQAGSVWGYRMVFVMLVLAVPLFFVQDAAGRLGIASGMGLGEAIHKFFGRRTAVMAALPMGVSDFLEYVAEYAGIAVGLYLLRLPILMGLLVAYLVHTSIVIGGKYRQAELVLLPLSFLVLAGIVLSTSVFHFELNDVFYIGLSPFQPYGNPSFDYLLAASIGAVVMPWMLYFHSGADSRKGKMHGAMRAERIETLIGAVVSEVLMVVIVLDGMHLSSVGSFVSVPELSKALSIFGENASLLMGIGFIAAGFLALVVISLGSAWGVLEALNKRSRKSFLTVYAIESLPAVLLVLVSTSYVNLVLDLMVIFTIVILPSLYFLGRLVTRDDVMRGNGYSRTWSIAFWIMSAFIVVGGLVGLASLL